MKVKVLLVTFLTCLPALAAIAAEPPDLAAAGSSNVTSGLIVVVGAIDTALAEALSAEGRMAVDLLTAGDVAQADAWRERFRKAGRAGFVSVVPLKSFAALPYADRFANLVVADFDALGQKAPDEKELRRVAAPFGALCLRKNGTWKVEKVPLPPELDEWTHLEHGPDGNPTSKDRAVTFIRGLQWASDATDENTSTARIGGGVHIRASRLSERHPSILMAREAANGLPRWSIVEDEGQVWKRSVVFEKSTCIAGGRLHGLAGNVAGWGQAIDLATGKTVLVYDQGVRAPETADNRFMMRQSEEERRWKSDVTVAGGSNTRGPYSHGLIHIALDGMIVQGGNVRLEGEAKPIPLGPTRIEKERRRPDEPQGPTSVTPVAVYQGQVAALDAVSGQRRWAWQAPEGMLVAHLIGGEGAVVVGLTQTTISLGVHYKNRFNRLAEVVVLDAKTGAIRWRSNRVKDFTVHHMSIADGGLYVANHAIYIHIGEFTRMIRFDLKSGKVDFDVKPDIKSQNDNWRNRFAVFDGRVHLGGSRTLLSFDARTGEDVQIVAVEMAGHGRNYSGFSFGHCSTWRATPAGWVVGRFARYIPYDGKIEGLPSVARPICDEGHYPAYGLIYTGNHPGCYCATYVTGAVALHGLPPEPPLPDDQRLVRGPAWGSSLGPPVAADQWPTLRADGNRSSHVEANLGNALKPVWTAAVAKPAEPAPLARGWKEKAIQGIAMPKGPIAADWPRAAMPTVSAPVVADGLVLVSVVHERTLKTIDVATGVERWSLSLPARLEYPPTIYRGMAYLGGNDGTVSCLRLTDGAMVWRFLAARNLRRLVFAGQVESAWPVPGVLVHDDKVYVAAGRHNQLDGGLHVWCLDPATGAILGRTDLDGRKSNQPPFDKGYTDHDGRTNDIMSVDRHRRAVHMRDIAIDAKTWDWLQLTAVCGFGYRPNLMRKGEFAGFSSDEMPKLLTRTLELHEAMHHPRFLRYGSNQGKPGQTTGIYGQEGKCLAVGAKRLVTSGEGGASLVAVALDADGLPAPLPPEAQKDKAKLAELRPTVLPYRPGGFAALATTPDRLVVACPRGRPDQSPQLLLLAADGSELAVAELPADPIRGNLAIAGTDVYVGTVDGGIHRFATKP